MTETPAREIRYILDPSYGLEVRPAPSKRDWMEATNQGFAKRCLPLTIANAHAWEVLNPVAFRAIWTGGDGLNDVIVTTLEDKPVTLAISHFGHGILTFSVPGLITTPPGWDLWVGPPVNRIKDGIQGLSGVVETDWSHFSFTMNWRFTRPGAIEFAAGEPFLAFHPVERGAVESFGAVLVDPAQGGDRMRHHDEWAASRLAFNDGLNTGDEAAVKRGWQKEYTQGPTEPQTPPHRTKLKLAAFKREG